MDDITRNKAEKRTTVVLTRVEQDLFWIADICGPSGVADKIERYSGTLRGAFLNFL